MNDEPKWPRKSEGWEAELERQKAELEKLNSDLVVLTICFEIVVVAAVAALVAYALLGR